MRRLILLVSLASAVALAAPAQAKPFTYSDAKGDALVPDAAFDIVGVTYSTEGVTSVTKSRGKTVKKYDPTKLVVTMTLAAAPKQQPGIKYRAEAQISECGSLNFFYAPTLAGDLAPAANLTVGCGGPDGPAGGNSLFLDPKLSIKGTKLIWSIPLKALPKVARAGALISQLKSSVDVVEPVLGSLGPDDFGSGVLDTASSGDDWEVS